MNSSRYYQDKRKAELKSQPKQSTPISEEAQVYLAVILGFICFIILSSIIMWNLLEDGRRDCEAQGGVFYSTQAGKVTIARCEGVD